MSTKNKPKQPYRPFAPVAKQMQNAAPKQGKEHTTTTAFIRHGEGNPKRTQKKPKHWSFNPASKQRTRAKKIKLSAEFWGSGSVSNALLTIGAGLPECKWTITCNNPARVLTSRDILYIYKWSYENAIRGELEVEYNNDHRILTFVDLTDILLTDSSKELATPTQNK